MDGEFAPIRPHPATSTGCLNPNPRHGTRRCVEHPANTPSPAHPYLLLHSLSQLPPTTHSDTAPPALPCHTSISCSSGLAPDHSSHDQGGYNHQSHCPFNAFAIAYISSVPQEDGCALSSNHQYLDISHMQVDSSHCRIFSLPSLLHHCVGTSQRTRTECDPIVSVIH